MGLPNLISFTRLMYREAEPGVMIFGRAKMSPKCAVPSNLMSTSSYLAYRVLSVIMYGA